MGACHESVLLRHISTTPIPSRTQATTTSLDSRFDNGTTAHRLGLPQPAEALELAAPPPASCHSRVNQILRLLAGGGIAGIDLLSPLEAGSGTPRTCLQHPVSTLSTCTRCTAMPEQFHDQHI